MTRSDGRKPTDLRPTIIELDTVPYAEGSCLIATGNTRVLCAASIQHDVPDWRASSGKGWVTGEYGMLPRATHTRGSRERKGPKGRTQEIQRLIGRSLRSVCDLGALGSRTIILDCDVIQADGGTRTASITGAAVALSQACRGLVESGEIPRNPMRELVAAVSVGLFDGEALLDLDYSEDSRAQVDMNLVVTEGGKLVEVQGTAEGDPFSRQEFTELLDLGVEGIRSLIQSQKSAIRAQ
jgi:ribonuclease PH